MAPSPAASSPDTPEVALWLQSDPLCALATCPPPTSPSVSSLHPTFSIPSLPPGPFHILQLKLSLSSKGPSLYQPRVTLALLGASLLNTSHRIGLAGVLATPSPHLAWVLAQVLVLPWVPCQHGHGVLSACGGGGEALNLSFEVGGVERGKARSPRLRFLVSVHCRG